MPKTSRLQVQSSSSDKNATLKEYKRQWHIKNRKKVIDKASKWNRDNHQRRLEIQAKNREKQREKIRVQNKIYRARYRQQVMEHYSHGTNSCACCGESIYEFLTIDHINGGGNSHRKSTNTKGGHHFYYWLIRNGFPEGFQVLCFNCNMAKTHFKSCPHTVAPL